MELGLDGKVAIITGGSEGIGAETARLLAVEGCDVAIGARREEPLAEAAATIREAGWEPLAQSMDVMSAEDCAGLVAATIDRFGGVDILINNAGTSRAGPFDGVADEVWQEDLNLKLYGANPYDSTVPALHAGARGRPGDQRAQHWRQAARRRVDADHSQPRGGLGANEGAQQGRRAGQHPRQRGLHRASQERPVATFP